MSPCLTAEPPPREAQPEPERGIRCRACNCAHFYTLETRRQPGGRIMRRKECRHCGRRITTYERAFGAQ